MFGPHPILLATLAGFVSALMFSSIPVGPINLTILNEGSRRGFRWAMLIGLGAATMEMIYCAIAFTGFSSFFDIRVVKASMELFTFVFLLFLGSKFLFAQTVNVPTKLDAASKKIEVRLDEKLRPHSAFMTGFVRVMGNLGVLLTSVSYTHLDVYKRQGGNAAASLSLLENQAESAHRRVEEQIWSAVICRRFERGDMSRRSKARTRPRTLNMRFGKFCCGQVPFDNFAP